MSEARLYQQGDRDREQRMMDVAARYKRERDEARELVRRAAPFVNAVVVLAEDKTPSLEWLADATLTVRRLPSLPSSGSGRGTGK